MLKQTSILAYHSLTNEKIGERQKQVYDALEELGTANNRMIAEQANLPINVVTPRIGELREVGMVEEAYKAEDSVTGRKTIFWTVK